MIDYAIILSQNYSDKEWSLFGDSYEGLSWNDKAPKPTQEDLDALWEPTLAAIAAKIKTAETAKQSAMDKLAKLGLTEAEVAALLGAK